MAYANLTGKQSTVEGIPAYELGGSDVGEILEKAVDREIIRHGV